MTNISLPNGHSRSEMGKEMNDYRTDRWFFTLLQTGISGLPPAYPPLCSSGLQGGPQYKFPTPKELQLSLTLYLHLTLKLKLRSLWSKYCERSDPAFSFHLRVLRSAPGHSSVPGCSATTSL